MAGACGSETRNWAPRALADGTRASSLDLKNQVAKIPLNLNHTSTLFLQTLGPTQTSDAERIGVDQVAETPLDLNHP